MKRISLTKGKFALVNNCDYKYLMHWKWRADKNHKTFYAARSEYVAEKRIAIYMHRVIFGGPCDHKNRNGLDTRRCNLRKATFQQQMRNRGVWKNCASGFKGLTQDKKKWVAAIYVNKKRLYLGRYWDKEKAAAAYDTAALKYFGEFAVLNFP